MYITGLSSQQLNNGRYVVAAVTWNNKPPPLKAGDIGYYTAKRYCFAVTVNKSDTLEKATIAALERTCEQLYLQHNLPTPGLTQNADKITAILPASMKSLDLPVKKETPRSSWIRNAAQKILIQWIKDNTNVRRAKHKASKASRGRRYVR